MEDFKEYVTNIKKFYNNVIHFTVASYAWSVMLKLDC